VELLTYILTCKRTKSRLLVTASLIRFCQLVYKGQRLKRNIWRQKKP